MRLSSGRMNAMRRLYALIECCLNWRVIAVLAFTGAALFIFAPKLAIGSLPVLVALVCPISMLVMIVSMGRNNKGGRGHEETGAFQNLSRDQQLQVLEQRLERVQVQRRAIASQLPTLERVRARPGVAAVAGGNGTADSHATVS